MRIIPGHGGPAKTSFVRGSRSGAVRCGVEAAEVEALDIDLLARNLAELDPVPTVQPSARRAAVALCLREAPDLALLFIRRAHAPNDPWSGHMAFPGGRVEPDDGGPLAAAMREAKEEVDLQLSEAQLLGPLSPQDATRKGRRTPLVIHPFVFRVPPETRPRPDSREVQETVWIPISYFVRDAERSTLLYEWNGHRVRLPCFDYDGRQIWGLTLRMLEEFLTLSSTRPATP